MDSITKLTAERAALWAEGGHKDAVAALTKRLTDAYESRRIERARAEFGDPVDIVRRARTEVELERIISRR